MGGLSHDQQEIKPGGSRVGAKEQCVTPTWRLFGCVVALTINPFAAVTNRACAGSSVHRVSAQARPGT